MKVSVPDRGQCVEMPESGETCSQAHARGATCHALYRRFRCCPPCDPCGIDGSLCSARPQLVDWVSPMCACDRVVLMGACSFLGCAKPDALGVFAQRRDWRTPDGRYVYVKEAEQPPQLHHGALSHKSVDASSGSNSSDDTVYLYFLSSVGSWVVGPRAELTDDNYVRSTPTDSLCPTQASGWRFWWQWHSGGEPLSSLLPSTPRLSNARGWRSSSRYPLRLSCWASPPSPPPPPPRPSSSPPPPPPMPPPPIRLMPGPYTGRLEIYYETPWQLLPPSAAEEGGGATGVSATSDPTRVSPRLGRIAAWGTVCDDGFDRADAAVACRQLGLGPPLRYWTLANPNVYDDEHPRLSQAVPRPAPPVWLENLQCGGEEAALTECGFRGWGSTDCSHTEDIYLLCAVPRKPPPPPPPTPAPELGSVGWVARAPLALGLTPVQLGALGGATAVGGVVALIGCLLALCPRLHAADRADKRPRREVRIALHVPPSAESGEQAQHALASALRKALEAEEGV